MPREVVPGALAYARAHPEDTVILVGDEAVIAPFLAGPAGQRPHASTRRRSSRWTSIPRWRCARRRTPRSSSPWTSSRRARPTRSSPRATRVPGWPPRSCASAACRGVDRPALAVQMVGTEQPVRAARHRRQPGLHRREPGPVRADGRDLQRARARGGPAAGGPAVDRRGEGQGRRADPAGHGAASTRRTSTSSATSRART